ncbi:reverse transcriptase/maturase family protein [Rhodococcus sp. NPDC057014]|uniref:reverse transcriptase/maturase family protein n=1 Tax=Rhodococcus sp. NPDC057014 TaxID=3346000 RepID=UPI00362FF7DA
MIPKPGSNKLRRLGIPTAMDHTVQASLLLVLEPIFEADFKPISYGLRPRHRAQDAIAEIHALGTRNHHWAFEADIAACFDELAHSAGAEGGPERRAGRGNGPGATPAPRPGTTPTSIVGRSSRSPSTRVGRSPGIRIRRWRAMICSGTCSPRRLLCSSRFALAAWHEREHEWIASAVLS